MDEVRAAAQAALPQVEGTIAVRGLRDPVEVLRDDWGVPSIFAASLDDLWFAQGFVTASERLFQIDLAIRAATGRLSELFGGLGGLSVEQDRFARVVGFKRIGEREADRWDARSRAMEERYVEGVRAFASSGPAPPVEHVLLGAAPELPDDLGSWAAALAFVAWGLSGNWDRELLRVHLAERFGPDAVSVLLPPVPSDPPNVVAGGLAGRLLDTFPRISGQGSNAWVVAGSRTESGKPLLANDPHLLVQQPAPWFELGLRAPGYDVRGVAFPFGPGIVIGTTPHHAWGITNASGDVQDLYEERLNEEGSAAEFDGRWEPLSVHREEIPVRGGEPVEVLVRGTRHGPLLEVETVGVTNVLYSPLDRAYALRWTASDGLLEPSALVDAATAASFEQFRQALRGLSCPGQNVVYADVDGTIGYQLTGLYPIRRNGDGTVPVPGWTSRHEWDGFVPFEELPWSKDPERGYIVTANNRPHDDTYPHLIGSDFHTSHRARRIAERIEENERISTRDAGATQIDTVSLAARELLPRLTALEPSNDAERWALEVLAAWNGDERADSGAAAIYNEWLWGIGWIVLGASTDASTNFRYLMRRESFVCLALPHLLDAPVPAWVDGYSEWSEVLRQALRDALETLESEYGFSDRSAWRWGAMHPVWFRHPLAGMPGPDMMTIFTAAGYEYGGDEQTILQASFDSRLGFHSVVVPSWRLVVDLSDVDRSQAVLTTGESGNPVSAHWNDQSPLWISGSLRPAPVTRSAVEAAVASRLTLEPGG
jgi:penicillin amidase